MLKGCFHALLIKIYPIILLLAKSKISCPCSCPLYMYGMFLLCKGEDVFPLLAPTVKCWHLSSWWIFSFKGSDSQEFKVGICPVHPLKKRSLFYIFIIGLVHTLAKNRSVGERGVPCIKYTSGTLHYILLPAGDSRSGQCWVYTGMKEN